MLAVYRNIKIIFKAIKAGACGCVLKRAGIIAILTAITDARAGRASMTSEMARVVTRSFIEASSMGVGGKARLSLREMEILALLTKGLSNAEVGNRLNLGVTTVRRYLMRIYGKVHIRSRIESAKTSPTKTQSLIDSLNEKPRP